jgi:hypothetical protein
LAAKRAQRLAKKQQGGLMRRLKNSFRKSPSMSTQRDEDGDATPPTPRVQAEPSNPLNSPAGYSTDSYVTIEVSMQRTERTVTDLINVPLHSQFDYVPCVSFRCPVAGEHNIIWGKHLVGPRGEKGFV